MEDLSSIPRYISELSWGFKLCDAWVRVWAGCVMPGISYCASHLLIKVECPLATGNYQWEWQINHDFAQNGVGNKLRTREVVGCECVVDQDGIFSHRNMYIFNLLSCRFPEAINVKHISEICTAKTISLQPFSLLLNHWGRVTHICVGELGHNWFR